MSCIIAAAQTEVGLVRDHNEDSFVVDLEHSMFVVADGMGGHAAGEVASKLAVDGVLAYWTSQPTQTRLQEARAKGSVGRQDLLKLLRDGVLEANTTIVDEAERDSVKRGMGTTIIALVVEGSTALFAHAGDSRAYLVRGDVTMRLSEDQTMVTRLRNAGLDTETQIQRYQGMLTNALGSVDSKVAIFAVPLAKQDILILCSDGVHDYVKDEEFAPVVLAHLAPDAIGQALVDMALDRGGADNATVIVVGVGELEEAQEPTTLQEQQETITRCPLFAGLNAQQIVRTLSIATPMTLRKGTSLSMSDAAYLLMRGECELMRGECEVGDTARSSLSSEFTQGLTSVRLGDVLQAESLLSQATSQGSLFAQSECELLVMRKSDFLALCDDEPDLGVVVYDNLGKLVRSQG